MRRIPALALILLLAAACTSGGAPEGAPSPTPSRVSTPRPSSTQVVPSELRVVVRAGDQVRLMTLDRRHRAHERRRLAAPRGYPQAEAVAVATGMTARVCVSWSPGDNDQRRVIACYDEGATTPRVVVAPRGPGQLALRADGAAMAWSELIRHQTYDTHNLVVADLSGKVARGVRRVTSSTHDCPGECFEGCSPGRLSWAGEERLLISVGCESDDGPGVRSLSLARGVYDKGWLAGSVGLGPTNDQKPYARYDEVGTADGTSALLVQRIHDYDSEEEAPERAVRVSLRDQRVVEVVATAQGHRFVASVSGGAAGLVYTTVAAFEESGPRDLRVYARLPGEARGTRVGGLPAYVQDVVAYG